MTRRSGNNIVTNWSGNNIVTNWSSPKHILWEVCRWNGKYTKLQEWKTQETFQREKFHVSESIPVQQSLSPEMQIFFFSFVWYVCFFGWILAFLGTYKYKCMFWVVFKGTHLVYFVQKFFPSHQELCLRLARVSEEDWDWQDWALKMQVFEDDSRRF